MAPKPTLRQYPGWKELLKWAKEERKKAPVQCAGDGCYDTRIKALGLCERHYNHRRGFSATLDTRLIHPDDGIIDEIALELAVQGVRTVRLTANERRLAADRILAAGGDVIAVAKRLGIPYETARTLVRRLTLIEVEW